MSGVRNSVCIDGRAGPSAAGGRGERALPYLPALDGLRAFAVIAVLLYHASLPWIPGGFLGVEVFFVISGYLITSLLLAEWARSGRIDLREFWLRRARRLLPAVAVLFLPGEIAGLRGDVLSSAAYVNNWYQVFSHKSYFEAVGRPSLLRHLWSLAVEEQFYVLWPMLFCVLLRVLRPRAALLAVLAGAAASAVTMALLYDPDVDPSRPYYGTDARAAGLLIGAALAFVWRPGRAPRPTRRWTPDAAGLLAFTALAACHLLMNEYQPFLYRGGFALVATATAALVAVSVHPHARLVPRLLSLAPLRWIGMRSYGIYLWHFPVFMLTRPQLDLPFDGAPLLAGRVALTFALAALSYRFVEAPIRRGALGRAWQAWQEAADAERRLWALRWGASSLALELAAAVLIALLFSAQPPAAPEYLRASPQEAALEPQTAAAESAAPAVAPAAPASAGSVTAIGDSVLLGVEDELRRVLGTNVLVDAELGRQASKTPAVARKLRAAGRIGSTVILHVGENGVFTSRVFDRIMAELADARRVVVVNVKVPRAWERPNNAMLAAAVARYPAAVLVDWNAASSGRPELFWHDGIHLRPAGARFYAGLIAQAAMAPETSDPHLALAVCQPAVRLASP